MKRTLSLLLILALLLTALPVGALALSMDSYGSHPIYLPYADINYMADDILGQMDLAGKSDREKIRTVYLWIIENCRRYGEPDPAHYDGAAISASPEFQAYVDD